MKATELRIGNYYIGCSRQEIEVVSGKTIEQFESGVLPCMKPILLNEEWLLRFGFRGNERQRVKRFVGLELYTKDLWRYNTKGNNALVVEYVHQLQNLYHALTGEELEIKDKDE